MNRKYIVILGILILLIIVIFFIKNNNAKNLNSNVSNYNIDVPETIQNVNNEIKENISGAINSRKNMFDNDTDKDFYLYFDLTSINSQMPDTQQIVLIENIKKRDFNSIEIYDYNGKLQNKFPVEKIKGVDDDIYNITANQDMLIKVYSEENGVTYYYKLKILENGKHTLTEICYTIGEFNEAEWKKSDSFSQEVEVK